MYRYTLSLTSALNGVGGQLHAPAALPPGKGNCYPLCKRVRGTQGSSGLVRKISHPHQDSIPGPSNPQRVAVGMTALSQPTHWNLSFSQINTFIYLGCSISYPAENAIAVKI